MMTWKTLNPGFLTEGNLSTNERDGCIFSSLWVIKDNGSAMPCNSTEDGRDL